ncbi:iron transport multicopper oxidase fet3 precursor [Xylariales sp. PMI_506]|nr:iron transport multicopper oxidase fet3 precursor [Xylariales sp. PMI_506]
MYKKALATLVALFQATAWAATVTYEWEVTWVDASPDGLVTRPVIGINNQWPCPTIDVNVGDTVVVKMTNGLGNETTGLHFHGISQIDTNFMDGAAMVNQCPVKPGSTITYQFLADAAGTFWYHSHNMGQYPDGLRGPLIVHEPKSSCDKYDEEVILTVSDWYHSLTTPLIQNMLLPNNTQFLPPFPDSLIVNEGGDRNIQFEVGKTYRVRIISFAAFASFMVHFGSHNMKVIMTDGSFVKTQEVDVLRLAPAQRYDVLITAVDADQGQNFPYLVAMDLNRDFSAAGSIWAANQTGYLVTDSSAPTDGIDVVDVFQPFDEASYYPYDDSTLLGPVTKTWQLDFNFCRDANGYSRACFNNETYISQKVPTLYSAATVGDDNSNPAVYGDVLPFVVNYGDVVEIVVNNLDAAIHPFHLHGHQFQIVERPASNAGTWGGSDSGANPNPPKRDVVAVDANSYARLRFVANNPGIFLFHCHIEWHVEMGLTATLIEAPEKLHNYAIPQDHLDACTEMGIPITGNAAGNSNPLDTTGFNTSPPTSYYGSEYPIPDGSSTKLRAREIRRKPNGQRFETFV